MLLILVMKKKTNIMRIFTSFLIFHSAWGLIDCQNRAQRNFDYCLGNIQIKLV